MKKLKEVVLKDGGDYPKIHRDVFIALLKKVDELVEEVNKLNNE